MTRYFLLMTLSLSILFSSCGKDEPDVPVDEELITTLNYTLTPTGGGDVVVLSFVDLDGEDGNDPVITGGTLQANTSYTGSLELLNESVSPVEDITEEIEEKDAEHQFFFDSDITGLNVAYEDQDASGYPVGLSNTLTTGAAGSGTFTIILKHEPIKDAAGVSDGDITNAGGESDIEASFPVDVE